MTTKDPSATDFTLPPASSTLPFVADNYLKYIEDCEMTEAQKVEFLRTLWDIMATFVRLGFGVDSVLPGVFQKVSENATYTIEQTIPTHEFNAAGHDGTAEKDE
ncbi:hypothetical protein [Thauera sp. SDU_THAU2]|uniref:hypothetical protein n=1 Tax=Thauera sp. SDU_THAU2 TaxID=3136633 RepID=UPI00311F695C